MQILVRIESANQIIQLVPGSGKTQLLAEIVEPVAIGVGALPDQYVGIGEVGILAVDRLPVAVSG